MFFSVIHLELFPQRIEMKEPITCVVWGTDKDVTEFTISENAFYFFNNDHQLCIPFYSAIP